MRVEIEGGAGGLGGETAWGGSLGREFVFLERVDVCGTRYVSNRDEFLT